MNMPVQLYALIWNPLDRQVIEDWAQQNADRVYIAGWSRLLLEPLEKAVGDPNIFGLAIDGVLINNHRKWSESSLQQAIVKLNEGTLKLYSVENGMDPLSSLPA